jgi:hypothetical protein
MLVNVNGQVCELVKAEAKGGNYHRRVPRKSGKGFNYYYDEDKYAASKQAHLDGPATRGARLAKAVLGAVDGAGKNGCSVKSLRAMAAKEGKEHVAKAIRGCLEKGDLKLKKGVLYRAMKEAAKDEQELADKPKRKGKSMREEPGKRKIEKSGPGLYLDELRKAKGPIGVGKRGGKIYGYDKHGKPIYNPGDAPDKPKKASKKKPSKPSPQLSLFGQTTLEKPKPKPEPKLREAPVIPGRAITPGVNLGRVTPRGDMSWLGEPPTAKESAKYEEKRAQIVSGEKLKSKPKPEPKPQLKVEPAPVRPGLRKVESQAELKAAPIGSVIRMSEPNGRYLEVKKVNEYSDVVLVGMSDREIAPRVGNVPKPLGEVVPRQIFDRVTVELAEPEQVAEPPKPLPEAPKVSHPVVSRIAKGYRLEFGGTTYTVLGSQKLRGQQYYILEKDGNKRSMSRQAVMSGQKAGTIKVLDIESRPEPVLPVEEKRTLVQKMVRVRELLESDYPNASQEQREDLYNKLVDAQAGRPGSDIDAAITEAEKLLAESQQSSHVIETPPETPATIEVEQAKHEPTEWAKRMKEKMAEEGRISGVRHLANMGHAEAQQELEEIERTRKPVEEYTPEQEAEIRATWEGLPRSGKGWKLITKPHAKQKLKRWVEDTVAKIDKLPVGSQVRVTEVDGKVVDWRVVGGGKLTLEALPEDMPMPTYVALPELGGAVFAQVEVKPAKAQPTEQGKESRVEPEAEHDTAEQHAAVALPELPPKPPTPPRIPRKEFGREMRRRHSEGLYSSKNTYPVKENIKKVGGVWDRYNNTWLLPSQEALDYIEALIPHKEAEQSGEADKAISEGRTVSGRTWDVRTQIKNAGGRWHGATKQWIMPDKESAEMMQKLVERTTTGSHGSLGGKPTARQIEVASSMLQKVGLETWKQTPYKDLSVARVRAMLPEMSMLEISDLISTMKGDK